MKKYLSVVLLILSASLLFADVPTSLQDNIKAISTIRETIDPLILQIKQVQANDDLGRQRGFFAFKITFLSTFLTDSAFRDTPEVRRLKATAAEFKANPDPAFFARNAYKLQETLAAAEASLRILNGEFRTPVNAQLLVGKYDCHPVGFPDLIDEHEYAAGGKLTIKSLNIPLTGTYTIQGNRINRVYSSMGVTARSSDLVLSQDVNIFTVLTTNADNNMFY